LKSQILYICIIVTKDLRILLHKIALGIRFCVQYILRGELQVTSVAENVGVGVHFNAFVPWHNKVLSAKTYI
jgi:hypothetical protein